MSRLPTRILLTAAVAFTLGVVGAGAIAQTNTLIIVADDLGVDSLGTYREGSSTASTPNIDALAARGVLFRNAYSNPLCSPTRATMLTGRYGFRTGLGTVPGRLPLAETTLPEILAPANVANALIGKWHLASGRTSPNDAGWSHFAGSIRGMGGGSETYYNWNRTVNGVTALTTVYATTQQVDDALAWIRTQTGPWVCNLSFLAPHTPFHAPPSSLHSENLNGLNPNTTPLPFYRATIEAIDTEIGRLFQSLGSTTLANTNVIFVGDNGTPRQVVEPPFDRRRGKGTIYEGGHNVPLIVAGPAVRNGGREAAALVHTVDLFHTVAELAGIDARQAVPASVVLDGTSIVPYLADPSQAPLREFVFVERFDTTFDDRSVRNDRYKLIRTAGAADELYDLTVDPFESTNLLSRALTPAERENRDRLSAQLDGFRDTAAYFPFGTGCGGAVGPPTLAAVGADRPVLGTAFDVEIANLAPAATAVVGVFGLSREDWAGLALPLDLTTTGMPGCLLYVRPDVLFPLPIAGGTARWTIPVPNVPVLLGLRFFQQAVVIEPGANATGAIVSPAAEGVVAGT